MAQTLTDTEIREAAGVFAEQVMDNEDPVCAAKTILTKIKTEQTKQIELAGVLMISTYGIKQAKKIAMAMVKIVTERINNGN